MPSKIKVLHCPLNNSNCSWSLSRAERKLGIQSDLIVFKKHPFFSNYDRFIDISGVTIPNELKRINFLHKALKEYDVFHFNFGQSIWDHPFFGLNYLDFSFIKRKGKKIIITFQGDDVRQKDYFIKNYGLGHYGNTKYSLIDKLFDANKRLRVQKIAKFADAIFAYNPDLLNILPKNAEFLSYPNTFDGSIKSKRKTHQVIIIHAPSDRVVKGSQEIIYTVKKLAQKYPIKLLLIEKMSHEKALELYQQGDICIDQIKVGWYGSFAVEAMSLSMPVIAYLRGKDLRQYVPFWQEIPIVNADANTLEDNLRMLIENPRLRNQLGKKSKEYIKKYHDPIKIAKITLKEYLK